LELNLEGKGTNSTPNPSETSMMMMMMTMMTTASASAAATTANYLLRRNTFFYIFGPATAIHSENLVTKE
jgi:hypothetical protein